MTRFDHIVNALQAAYADSMAEWLIGAEHVFSNTNWNRIVAYPIGGSVQLPGIAAQGHRLEDLNTQQAVGARDDILWERHVNVELGIWAASYAAAEDRLHAMLVALATVAGSANLEVSNIQERWLRGETKDVSSGGALVLLTFVCTFYVLSADADVVVSEVPIGGGVLATPVENVDITVIVDDESASFGLGG